MVYAFKCIVILLASFLLFPLQANSEEACSNPDLLKKRYLSCGGGPLEYRDSDGETQNGRQIVVLNQNKKIERYIYTVDRKLLPILAKDETLTNSLARCAAEQLDVDLDYTYDKERMLRRFYGRGGYAVEGNKVYKTFSLYYPMQGELRTQVPGRCTGKASYSDRAVTYKEAFTLCENALVDDLEGTAEANIKLMQFYRNPPGLYFICMVSDKQQADSDNPLYYFYRIGIQKGEVPGVTLVRKATKQQYDRWNIMSRIKE